MLKLELRILQLVSQYLKRMITKCNLETDLIFITRRLKVQWIKGERNEAFNSIISSLKPNKYCSIDWITQNLESLNT